MGHRTFSYHPAAYTVQHNLHSGPFRRTGYPGNKGCGAYLSKLHIVQLDIVEIMAVGYVPGASYRGHQGHTRRFIGALRFHITVGVPQGRGLRSVCSGRRFGRQ
ncbi:hypothetical protein D3C71_1750650 [compost metagenome]